jgi:hypothetical protein
MAEEALQRGDCDLVGMTRAHISDPDIVKKIRAGELHRIRTCVGANECVDRKLGGLGIACFHNPDVGREPALLPLADRPRRILVVGAGPAGLKAAEIAARRGHEVTLADTEHEAGGKLRHVRSTAARALYGSVTWILNELGELKVDVRLGCPIDEAALLELAPDAVVLASGARPRPDRAFPGAEAAPVISSADALARGSGGRVVVLDRIGHLEASLVAEALAVGGAEVTFVTPFEVMAPLGGYTHREDLKSSFHDKRITVVAQADIVSVQGGSFELGRDDGTSLGMVDADTVVAVTAAEPELFLTDVLDRQGVEYRTVGDALAPRTAIVAIREGEDAARAL